ncbi:galactokinase [Paenibacillus sp. CAA11]|uniref:galactokinase n=1 Tax=Paenibacillus sp. CAA11 TaxID=1532905 RepID=UPI000D336553|nr:galactokinase [Paenibacillus sp. CAA11]AWB45654.1 galactokinase [Paenibacillus sp. CAA11]
MNLMEMKQAFTAQFGESSEEISVFQAPGRVNLIGEHIDYNGGYVLPAALEFGTTLLLRPRQDKKLSFKSMNFPYHVELHGDVKSLAESKTGEWVDYSVGVIVELGKLGRDLTRGYDFLYNGEIPNGSGLSSSASIEVVTAYGLLSTEGYLADRVEIAVLSQKAENGYVGVNSGIMDQFAVANGAKDHAILLMCDTLEYTKVPFVTGDYKLVISNTNKRRGLVDSKYNERRSECDQALQLLQSRVSGLDYLAQLTPEQLEEHQAVLETKPLLERAKHVVEENARVLKSVEALKQGDLAAFGQLMNASHDSLRDLYEVSCEELDVMVEEARKIPGTLGSRMTGAGFGGCTVSLVHQDDVEKFVEQVGKAYEERTGLKGDFYVCGVGEGVHQIEGV